MGESWPSEWLRGVLDLCVLRVLRDGPTYGYAITLELARQGLGNVKGGTLYPLLGRLEHAGEVTAEWRAGEGGPGRKYYRLTEAGQRRLGEYATRWRSFALLTSAFITEPAPAPAAEHV